MQQVESSESVGSQPPGSAEAPGKHGEQADPRHGVPGVGRGLDEDTDGGSTSGFDQA